MTLLERLEASLAQLAKHQGQEPDLEAAAAEEVLRLRAAAATEAVTKLRAWVSDGSQLMNEAWDLIDTADSAQLCALLRDVTNREAGLNAALGLLVRHVEDALGNRHGRGGIEVGDVVIGAVDRAAGSTKWKVDEAWPAISAGIRQAPRLPIGDPADGEVEDDTARALRLIKALAGVSYLRVEVCRELGLDPDDYRTKSGYRWVVKLP